MKDTFLLAFALFFSTLCRAQQCGEEFFIVHPNSAIHPLTLKISPGDKLVFEYTCQSKNFDKTIASDMGMRKTVLFEIPADRHAFHLKDEQLATAKTQVSRFCHCPPVTNRQQKGTMEGRQVAPGTWEITMHVVILDASGKEVFSVNSSGVYR